MAATAGKKALLKVATTQAGPYTTVKNVKASTPELDAQNLDISQLGDDWISRIQGMKDAKVSASGQYDLADTTGQVVIVNAFLNDTPLYIQVLINGVNGFQMQVKVAKVSSSLSTSGEAQVSFDFEQTGGVTLI